MFFVEYTEHDERKALNLAMCQTIETKMEHRSNDSTFSIIIKHERYNSMCINFDTEEELLETFDSLMNAVKEYQAHWMSPKPVFASKIR